MSDVTVHLGPLVLRNPVMVASGTFGSGVEAADAVDLARIGAVVTKTVTTRPRAGNPPPRIHETAAGMLNSIGLMNPGLDAFRRDVLPRLINLPCKRVVNVAGESVDDFETLTRAFGEADGVDAIELNVSCPNVAGGLDFGVEDATLEALVSRCRKATQKPLIVKLTPNVTDLRVTARAAERGGADALSLVNTYIGLAVDWRTRTPRLGSPVGTGGLSGPAIKPLALRAVHVVAGAVRIPIVGIGGIRNVDDMLEFIVTGATAVQIGTQNFVDPSAAVRVVDDLESLIARGDLSSPAEIRGTLRIPRVAHA